MALLVEGLAVGGEPSIEEYVIGPVDEVDEDHEQGGDEDHIKLYGPEEGLSWLAKPVTGGSRLSLVSRQGSIMDPLVTLFSSVHEKLPEAGSMRSMLFPNFGSMFSTAEPQDKEDEEWDEESFVREGEGYESEGGGVESDSNLQSPLISRQTTTMEKGFVPVQSHGSLVQGNGEGVGGTGIGGGWRLAWKWSEGGGGDGMKGGFKRIYLRERGSGMRRGSLVSLPGGDEDNYIHAAAIVSQPALYAKELVGPAMVHPSQDATNGMILAALVEPGIKRALFVGIGLQMLQQVLLISYYSTSIGIARVLFVSSSRVSLSLIYTAVFSCLFSFRASMGFFTTLLRSSSKQGSTCFSQNSALAQTLRRSSSAR